MEPVFIISLVGVALAESAVSVVQIAREKLVADLAVAEIKLKISLQNLEEARANGSKLSEQLKLEMAEIADTLMKRNSQQMAQSNEEKIGEAQSNYDHAFKQLSTGRGNIIGKIEELKKMGANAGKQLPDRDN